MHDTASLLAALPGALPGENYTVRECLDEVKDLESRRVLEIIKEKLVVMEPAPSSVEKVRKAAREVGERLSDADVKVIALALDLGATIFTDDYGVMNVAKKLGLNAKSVRTAGISETVEWVYFCPNCGETFPPEVEVCPNCGVPLKRRPKVGGTRRGSKRGPRRRGRK